MAIVLCDRTAVCVYIRILCLKLYLSIYVFWKNLILYVFNNLFARFSLIRISLTFLWSCPQLSAISANFCNSLKFRMKLKGKTIWTLLPSVCHLHVIFSNTRQFFTLLDVSFNVCFLNSHFSLISTEDKHCTLLLPLHKNKYCEIKCLLWLLWKNPKVLQHSFLFHGLLKVHKWQNAIKAWQL